MKKRILYSEYFNELHHIDVSPRYSELMQTFVNQPDLAFLFAGYWREYISQFPEAIFAKVNENFYAEFRKLNTSIEAFELQPEDTTQIAGYVDGLRREYPEARISQYVIYCFGNLGFRVFTV